MIGWETAKLTEICQVQTGKWDANHATENGKFKFFTCAYESFLCDTKRFDGDCLILPGNGVNVGEVFYYSGEFDAYQRTYVISEIQILPKFLFYQMKCFWRERNLNKQFGSATNFLKIGNFKDYEVSYPSIPEQRRIVAILDEAFEGIATATTNAEKNLANARELFESYFNNLFSDDKRNWTEVSLKDVCEISSMLVDPKIKPYADLFHIGAGNIDTKSGELSGLMTAQEEGLKSGKFPFDEAMVLYSKIRPYLMKVARPDFAGICSADIYPLLPMSEKITRDFLFYLLLSPDFTQYAIAGSARAGMPKVNRPHLFAYRFLLPSIEEQNQITNRLEIMAVEVKSLEVTYQQKLSDLAELKQSILQKAFSGELTQKSA